MSRSFKFVHTADIHLDAPFVGVSAKDVRVQEELIRATYAALDRVATIAVERQVDFVVVAGDIYNTKDKSTRAQLRFRSVMQRLAEANIGVYLVHGNHDPANGYSAGLDMPDNVHYFSTTKVERIEVKDASGQTLCALYGQGFGTAVVTDNLARRFSRQAGDETAIGVLHANVGGQQGYENYAPCTLQDLRDAKMDYWALGHIHKKQDLGDSPKIRYCGSPQGLNPKEDGAHGCWVVTMNRGEVTEEEFVETDSVRWHQTTIDVGQMNKVDDLVDALRDECTRCRVESGGRPAIVRIDLVGRTEVNASISRGSTFDEVVEELRREQLEATPWLLVERVRNRTHPAFDIEFLREVEDFTGDLIRFTDTLEGHTAAKAFLGEVLGGVDTAFGEFERDEAELIRRARDLSLSRLLEEDR
ncbi:MAG: DNA repair exonuclease [Actinobacteria bacterium]|nr:DNA repair exonuclease [Actinomycetota bacterium]